MIGPMRSATLTLFFALSSLAPAQEAASEPARPNIVVILSDDHAQAAMGAYGSWLKELDPTPRLGALAAQGVLFENAFCTNSLCGPSRASFLTGKHSFVNGFTRNGDRFDGAQPTFPSMLQGAGYTTAVIGKWHLCTDPVGFDHWQVLPGQGDYYNPVLRGAEGKQQYPGHASDVVTDLAIEWLDGERDPEQPFLLLAWHKAPHRNWMPAPAELGHYQQTEVPVHPSLFDDYADNASPARYHRMGVDKDLHPHYDLFVPEDEPCLGKDIKGTDQSGLRNLRAMNPEQRAVWDAAIAPNQKELNGLEGRALVEAKHQRYVRQYLETVRGMDRNVGRLLDHLDATGLAENTLVIYASDQGFFLGEHGWYDKRWMYEESLRLPMVVRWPGHTEPGARAQQMVQNIDLAPTLLEAAGVAVPEDIHGRSMLPLLKGKRAADWRDAIYYHYYEYPGPHAVAPHRGIRTERHKLIQFYPFQEWELYDLQADPGEMRNLFGQPMQAGLTAELTLRLGEMAASFGEQVVMPPYSDELLQRFRPEGGDVR